VSTLPANPTVADLIAVLQKFPPTWLVYVEWESAITPPATVTEFDIDAVIIE
jgi:hypothetical protein